MKKFIFLISFFAALYSGPSAHAQLLIEEGKINLSAKGGDTITNSITVHNTTDQTINVRAYWEDFVYVEPFDGKKDFFPSGTTENSITTFASFSPAEFGLGPFATKKISYSIKVPGNAQGGYYGVLFFEKIDQDLKTETGVNVITRVGCLFFLEAENKNKTGQVEDLTSSAGNVTGTFLNSGNVILLPEGVFYVLGEDGLVADRGELGKFYLPPGGKTQFSTKISPELTAGNYTLVMTFDLGEGDTLVKEADFTKVANGPLTIKEVRD